MVAVLAAWGKSGYYKAVLTSDKAESLILLLVAAASTTALDRVVCLPSPTPTTYSNHDPQRSIIALFELYNF